MRLLHTVQQPGTATLIWVVGIQALPPCVAATRFPVFAGRQRNTPYSTLDRIMFVATVEGMWFSRHPKLAIFRLTGSSRFLDNRPGRDSRALCVIVSILARLPERTKPLSPLVTVLLRRRHFDARAWASSLLGRVMSEIAPLI